MKKFRASACCSTINAPNNEKALEHERPTAHLEIGRDPVASWAAPRTPVLGMGSLQGAEQEEERPVTHRLAPI